LSTRQLSEEAAGFALDLSWADVPEAVRSQLAWLLLDHAAVCAAGRTVPAARIAADYASAAHAGGDATALLDGRALATPGAAWANGVLANVLDFDDGHRFAKGHPGAIVIPAALAAAQAVDATVEEFLVAVLVGYEIAIRAGVRQHERMPLYHASGSWGALGAAAAVGRLIGLERRRLGHALGIAEYHGPIALMPRAVADPAMTKDATGWGAFLGVSSAMLAQRGYTALAPSFAEEAELRLGDRWDVLDVYVKPYPCCRWTQPAIEAALALVRAQGALDPGRIRSVAIHTFAAAAGLSRRRPTTTEEMQYSLTWPVAVALVAGRFGIAEALHEPVAEGVAAVESVTTVEVLPELTAAFPARRLAEIVLEQADADVLRSGRLEALGEPGSPEWRSVIEEKARSFLAPTAGPPPERLGGLGADEIVDLLSRGLGAREDAATRPARPVVEPRA
jgi:2-methylcitrate dehydratase PrpD